MSLRSAGGFGTEPYADVLVRARLRADAGIRDRLSAPSPLDMALQARPYELEMLGSARYLPPVALVGPVTPPADGSRFVTEYADLALNVPQPHGAGW